MSMSPFLAYDIRGKIGEELTEDMAYEIGLAYAELFKPKKVVIGRDVRPSSPIMSERLADGLNDAGVHVLDIGLCGTEGRSNFISIPSADPVLRKYSQLEDSE